jgi:hypothetical protein
MTVWEVDFLLTRDLKELKKATMKKSLFKFLALINKAIVPRYSKKDITKLTKAQQAIVAYRYWVTLNSLD